MLLDDRRLHWAAGHKMTVGVASTIFYPLAVGVREVEGRGRAMMQLDHDCGCRAGSFETTFWYWFEIVVFLGCHLLLHEATSWQQKAWWTCDTATASGSLVRSHACL